MICDLSMLSSHACSEFIFVWSSFKFLFWDLIKLPALGEAVGLPRAVVWDLIKLFFFELIKLFFLTPSTADSFYGSGHVQCRAAYIDAKTSSATTGA